MLSFDPAILASRHKYEMEPQESEWKLYPLYEDEYERTVAKLIGDFGDQLNSSDGKAIGTLFVKRYSPLFAGAVYAWLFHGHPFDLSPSNVQPAMNGALFKYYLLDALPLEGISSLADDGEKDEAYMHHVIDGHARPLVGAVARLTGVPELSLWRTVAYSMAYWQQEWLLESGSEAIKGRIGSWFLKLTSRESKAWLPEYAVNPLSCQFREVDDPTQEGRKILIRKVCCLNYRVFGKERYCSTCPLISEERRLEKLL
ncbi:IucA/IucC family C-terminal-domain containing protein [Cohnella suwonensis]|uniref:IucA/IucC family C-terminal-domain containing protein n=1 Tax=Cohnella suwonensis TaxID=696072 RepID=A0ABW0LWN1_9BACL